MNIEIYPKTDVLLVLCNCIHGDSNVPNQTRTSLVSCPTLQNAKSLGIRRPELHPSSATDVLYDLGHVHSFLLALLPHLLSVYNIFYLLALEK